MVDKTKPKRKFLDLGVNEISLVDEPANESPILVMKRKEQDDMKTSAAETQTEETTEDTTTTKSGSETEVIEVDAGEETPADIVKQLKDIAEKLVTKVKGSEESTDEDDDVEKKKPLPPFMQKAEDEKTKKAAALRSTLKASGLDDGKINAAVKAAFGDSGLGVAPGKPVKKGAEPVDEEMALDVMELMSQAISTAKKFTPKRVAELKDVVTKLNLLLGEVTEESPAKAAFGASGVPAQGTVPTTVPPVTDHSNSGVGGPRNTITKGVDADVLAEAVTKSLEPLTEALANLNGRMESIEKARSPKTAQTEDETETTETTKSANIWSGVL